jgi:peroxiredoxin
MLRWGLVVLVFTAGVVASNSGMAGEYNPVLNIGDKAPAWENLPGVDGKKHSLSDLKETPVVVVVFTCNSCPYAVDYEDRVNALAKKHQGDAAKVKVVAINVNLVEADSLAKMQERAKEKGFAFPYLFDESQKIAKDYGATRTPEFFVLDAERKIVYMGAMDDSSDAAKVTKHYVGPAIDAALAGKPADVKETVAVGCNIRFARKRREAD